jgi:predicted phage terminase large subunit-like protein
MRDVMFQGESGLVAVADRYGLIREHNKSQGRLVLANGSTIQGYTAEKPDRLRGPQHHGAWADELAAWRYDETWANLKLGLRLGDRPRVVVTTTPRPTARVRALLEEDGTTVTRGSTHENADNLSAAALQELDRLYGGTRMGKQELLGEVLDDVEGALWSLTGLDLTRVREAPALERIVVAVDPAVTSGPDSDETGIVVAGKSGEHYYIVADLSDRYTPDGWAVAATTAYHKYEADRVIGETNNGGDLIETVLRQASPDIPYRSVRASRGKLTRAEPVAALSEQGRVHIVGSLPDLETQLVTWAAGSPNSPDRLDAMVWAITELVEHRPMRRARSFRT